jgi:MYXO-CTERM domain-containing protein
VTPATSSLAPGATVQLTLSLRNNSSSTCAAETFRLDASVPDGWARSFSNGQSMTLVPGGQGSMTVTVQASGTASAGTYPVGVSAVGVSSGLVVTQAANITVNVPVSSPPPETPPPATTPPPPTTPQPEKTPVSSSSSGSGGGGGSADAGLLLLSLMFGAVGLRRRKFPLPL